MITTKNILIMKNSIITLAILATALFSSCSPEEQPKYDAYIYSPNTYGPIYVTDTIFKETFGTFKDSTIETMPVNWFRREPKPYTYSSDAKFSSMTTEDTLAHLPNEPLIKRELHNRNNVLHFDRNKRYGEPGYWYYVPNMQNMMIDDINVFTTKMHKEVRFNMLMEHTNQELYFKIFRSKDGINYKDEMRVNITKTANGMESQNLNTYLDGYNFVRVKINIILEGYVDNFSVITRD